MCEGGTDDHINEKKENKDAKCPDTVEGRSWERTTEHLHKSAAASLTNVRICDVWFKQKVKNRPELWRKHHRILGSAQRAEWCLSWDPGQTHTAGQGSFWQLLWLSSGRVKGLHCCSSTIPVVLSTQWTICLWTPGRAEEVEVKAQPCSDLLQDRKYTDDVKKSSVKEQTHIECGDVRQQNTKYPVKFSASRGWGGFVLLCGGPAVLLLTLLRWSLPPSEKPLRALCSARWGPQWLTQSSFTPSESALKGQSCSNQSHTDFKEPVFDERLSWHSRDIMKYMKVTLLLKESF